ncbi:hypothetical protein Trydic_g17748 [Trypoxylus dichotomus]
MTRCIKTNTDREIRSIPPLLQLSITEIRTIKSKKGVSWSCRNCNILSSDINDLKAAILSLRNDLAAREKSAGIDGKAFEELLAELGDRNNRKQNIIMFGVPESDTHDANTRRSRELETVQAVLEALPSGMNTDHIEFGMSPWNRSSETPVTLWDYHKTRSSELCGKNPTRKG